MSKKSVSTKKGDVRQYTAFGVFKNSLMAIAVGILVAFATVSLVFLIQYALEIQRYSLNNVYAPADFLGSMAYSFVKIFFEEAILRWGLIGGVGYFLAKQADAKSQQDGNYLENDNMLDKMLWLLILASALLGTIIHVIRFGFNPLVILNTFLGGVMYGWALVASRNLLTPLIMHGIWNFFSILYGYGIASLGLLAGKYPGFDSFFYPDISNNFIDMMTGTNLGPEATILGTLARVLGILLIMLFYRAATVDRKDDMKLLAKRYQVNAEVARREQAAQSQPAQPQQARQQGQQGGQQTAQQRPRPQQAQRAQQPQKPRQPKPPANPGGKPPQ